MTTLLRTSTIDPSRTRAALAGGEALFGAGVICPETVRAVQALGVPVELSAINFVTRTAPMGAVDANVAISVFFNFNPRVVRQVIPAAWDAASPEAILGAHASAFDGPLRTALSSLDSDDLREYSILARTAAMAASTDIEGRPLFASFAQLPWPDTDHLVAWHAGKLLREHRGDGHVALLTAEGLSGIEALVVHEAFEPAIPKGLLRKSRSWSREEWDTAIESLRSRGWLTADDVPTLTSRGHDLRRSIETRTDQLAARPYEAVGSAGMERLTGLGTKVASSLRGAGLTLHAFFESMRDSRGRLGTAD